MFILYPVTSFVFFILHHKHVHCDYIAIMFLVQHVRRSIQPRSHGPLSTSSLSTSSLEVERGPWEQGCVPLFKLP